MRLSVIIPTLNEEKTLGRTLERVRASGGEILVVDGGSTDRTVSIARRFTTLVSLSPPGRGLQQHKGACSAKGDLLLFLHADTLLPPGFEDAIVSAMGDPRVCLGAFRLTIEPSTPFLAAVAFGANLRARSFRLPYGDQALFMRRSAYFRVGGFRPWPVMEDVDLVRRLRPLGTFCLLPLAAQTSDRRWRQETPPFTTARNWFLLLCYFLGVSPHRLARHYRHRR